MQERLENFWHSLASNRIRVDTSSRGRRADRRRYFRVSANPRRSYSARARTLLTSTSSTISRPSLLRNGSACIASSNSALKTPCPRHASSTAQCAINICLRVGEGSSLSSTNPRNNIRTARTKPKKRINIQATCMSSHITLLPSCTARTARTMPSSETATRWRRQEKRPCLDANANARKAMHWLDDSPRKNANSRAPDASTSGAHV